MAAPPASLAAVLAAEWVEHPLTGWLFVAQRMSRQRWQRQAESFEPTPPAVYLDDSRRTAISRRFADRQPADETRRRRINNTASPTPASATVLLILTGAAKLFSAPAAAVRIVYLGAAEFWGTI